MQRNKTEKIVGIYVTVFGKMLYYAVIFLFLLTGYFYAVNFAGNKVKLSQGSLAHNFLVKGSGKHKKAVCAAKTVHFR